MKRKLVCLLMVLALVLSIPIPSYAASSMKISDSCLTVIKTFEGFSGKPYWDKDHYTIGYGTRCPDDKVTYYTNNPMSEAEAEAELLKEIVEYEKAVNSFIDTHGLTYTQGQFDAVLSLVFNCGTSWLTKGNTLIKALTQGYEGNDLIYAFAIYSMNGSNRSVAHVKRRLAEANMYLNASYSYTPPENYSYVLFDGNGGEVSTYNVQGYDVNSPVAPIPTATYSGKTFQGWYTKATGGTKVTTLNASTKEMTLYAHWGTEEQAQITVPDADVSQMTGMLIPSGNAITAVKVTVTASSLNLRKGPGTTYKVVGSAAKGEVFTISAICQGGGYLWGRYSGGWLCLDYTDYEASQAVTPPTQETTTVTKTYATVVGVDKLNVRSEPEGEIVGSLAEGTKVEILEQKLVGDRLWGRCTQGWISLRSYAKLETVTQVVYQSTQVSQMARSAAMTVTGVVTASCLNVRVAPGVGNEVVDWLYEDDAVQILEYATVNDTLWGRTEKGWICLRYVKS